MARYQIILAYDGTGFLGSQRQASSRTAQSELEKALRKLGWHGQTVYLAGRTDTGTHASGQVAAFDLDWGHGLEKLQDALNAHLPRDMAVREVKVAADHFHPRFDATSRRYRYRLFCANVRDPLRERYAWRVWPAVKDMMPIGQYLALGGMILRFWNSSPIRRQHGTDRHVCQDGSSRLTSGFLKSRRMLSFTAWCAGWSMPRWRLGRRRLSADTLARALDDRPEVRQEAQAQIPASLAPACGLTLVEVRYDNLV